MDHAEPFHAGEPHDKEKIPRLLVRAMFGMMFLSLIMVSYARLTDRPLEAKPAEGPIAQERVVYIFSDMTGAAKVLDQGGAVIADLGPDGGGFISGVGRALERERAKTGVNPDAPVHLIRYADGRLALRDDYSGWRIELLGFGRDNAAAFSGLLDN
ncbi:photosynthetic complex assembly protein PuhC [Tropicimonas sp. IMCC34043]|uniref:photosynthetic complex assembly protein PuhC n=1 Tax=Tropicimonas sp. IMCC34043 TaxID=2248760 RepID=UPI000E24C027|nr:photosynthetic complex assembly protein PuhC [Tropicimonas sp. IMCC34043]